MSSTSFDVVLGRPDHGIVWTVTVFEGYTDPYGKKLTEDYLKAHLKSVQIKGGYQWNTAGYLHLSEPMTRKPHPLEIEWAAKMWLPGSRDARWELLGCSDHGHEWLRGMFVGGRSAPEPPSFGASVCRWAFEGLSPDEISRRYGDGSKLYLTAPVADDGVTILRRPRDPELGHPSEHLLENAVEDGRLAGAAAADI